MAEPFNSRVFFSKGKQQIFIAQAKESLGMTDHELANFLRINPRTLTDWKRERFSMTLNSLNLIIARTGTSLPRDITIRKQFWYVTKGARKGGLAHYKKYGTVGGDPRHRLEQWRMWWNREGKRKPNKILLPFPVRQPKKSALLAEFTGIVLGDGGISKYQATVTLHHETDKEYSRFVSQLIQKLFDISPSLSIRPSDSTISIVISRRNLIFFLTKKLGLREGNKVENQVDIPQWIKEKREFRIACLRGLMDTDGSVMRHRYLSKGKYHTYMKLDFTNRSKPLLYSVGDILKELGIKYRFRDQFQIRVEAQKDVERYFAIVNSNNPRHLKKYHTAAIMRKRLRWRVAPNGKAAVC